MKRSCNIKVDRTWIGSGLEWIGNGSEVDRDWIEIGLELYRDWIEHLPNTFNINCFDTQDVHLFCIVMKHLSDKWHNLLMVYESGGSVSSKVYMTGIRKKLFICVPLTLSKYQMCIFHILKEYIDIYCISTYST